MADHKFSRKDPPIRTGDTEKVTEQSTEKMYRNPGLRDVKTTGVFRVVNFELFAKPNKIVMGVGILVLSSCVAYLAYLNADKANKRQYTAMNDDGSFTKRKRASRWD